jgi:putative sterol carrier protein
MRRVLNRKHGPRARFITSRGTREENRKATPAPRLNFRQTIEGMALVFNPAAAGDLAATIEFEAGGAEPGAYHLSIAGGECTFRVGPAAAPTLTITTPSEVWLKIRSGELNGTEALKQGLYTVSGDLSLLPKMGELFKAGEGFSIEARDPNPPGPITLSGMVWMQAAFVPWYVFWVFFEPHGQPLLEIGLPLLLVLCLISYRVRYNETTLFEIGGAGFFAVAGLLTLAGAPGFNRAGSLIGSLVLAALWFGSLFAQMPLSGDYVKWGFIKPMWRNSMFIYPNAVIALVWGCEFVIAALVGIGATVWPGLHTPLTVVRYGLMVPATFFTVRYARQARQLRVDDFEQTLARLRLWAGIGLAVTAVLIAGVWVLL